MGIDRVIKVSFRSFKNIDVTRGQYRGIISELCGGKGRHDKNELRNCSLHAGLSPMFLSLLLVLLLTSILLVFQEPGMKAK